MNLWTAQTGGPAPAPTSKSKKRFAFAMLSQCIELRARSSKVPYAQIAKSFLAKT